MRDRSIFAPLLTIDLSGRPVGRTRDDPDYLAILGTPKHGGCLIIQFFPNSCAIIPSILMEACRCGRAPSGLSTFKKTMIFEKNAIRFCVLSDFSFYDYTPVSYAQILSDPLSVIYRANVFFISRSYEPLMSRDSNWGRNTPLQCS